jgi:CMP-N,N'-diacetyllegionaminic acid synthase
VTGRDNSQPGIVAIVPARGGSKAVPDKNIRDLGGFPLIAYSIAAGLLSRHVQRVIVSTDSERIAEIGRAFGAEVPFLRPAEISRDASVDAEFFRHYLEFEATSDGGGPEFLVHLRPTTPLRNVQSIDEAISMVTTTPRATSLRSVFASSFNPHKAFELEDGVLKGYFADDPRGEYWNLPRQAFPQTFVSNGYVDVVRKSTIDGGTLHGDHMLGYVTDLVPDIDVLEDYEVAEGYLTRSEFEELITFMHREYRANRS